MDYEITYKEALEKAKKKKENSRNLELLNFIEDTFPELKESKDERIRKWIIGVLSTYEYDKDLRNAAVTWLEKQNYNVVNANKEYWRGYREGKQDILNKYGVCDNKSDWNEDEKINIFHELEESEDERIRRVFRGWIYTRPTSFFDGISKEKMLAWLEKQGKNNMGIPESTKQKLDANLNKALEKETPESWNEFLDKQVEWSEEDERIRKGLTTAVSGTFDGNTLWHTDVTKEEALAWLEKIGEHIRFWLCKAVQAKDRIVKPRKGFAFAPSDTDSEFTNEIIWSDGHSTTKD